jgi:hypothetical protein
VVNNVRYVVVVNAVNKVMDEYTIRLTIRQLYYRIISPPFQLFDNNLNNYKSFDKIVTKARERGDVDWKRIEDRARSTLGGNSFVGGKLIHFLPFPEGWLSPEEYLAERLRDLKNCAEYYMRETWNNQPRYVEVWVEKDALAALFTSAVKGFRVITFPSRGYSSFTKIMEAITERFMEHLQKGQQITVLHFSDHDPSGLHMTEDIVKRLKEYLIRVMNDAEAEDETQGAWQEQFSTEHTMMQIYRVALTYDQVKQFQLASNPTKSADPRSKNYVAQYGNQCWELDAVPPNELQKIIQDAVSRFIDADLWNETEQAMRQEQQQLRDKLAKLKVTFEGA